MSLSERLQAELTGICADERAWVPLRRGFVDELLGFVVAAEQLRQAVELVGWGSKTPVEPTEDQREPVVSGREHPPMRRLMDNESMKALAISELQRLAQDGKAPTHTVFNANKDERLPTMSSILYRLNTTLSELVAAAGLEPAGMGRPRDTTKRSPALVDLPTWDRIAATNGHSPAAETPAG